MPTSAQEIQAMLESLELNFKTHDSEILVPFQSEVYTDSEGDHTILVVIRLTEDQRFIQFFCPMAFRVEGDAAKWAVIHTISLLSWRIPMVKFNYDFQDGEIRPTIDFPLFDGELNISQFHCCLQALTTLLDELYEPISYAIQHGRLYPELINYLQDESGTAIDPQSIEPLPESIETMQHRLTSIGRYTK